MLLYESKLLKRDMVVPLKCLERLIGIGSSNLSLQIALLMRYTAVDDDNFDYLNLIESLKSFRAFTDRPVANILLDCISQAMQNRVKVKEICRGKASILHSYLKEACLTTSLQIATSDWITLKTIFQTFQVSSQILVFIEPALKEEERQHGVAVNLIIFDFIRWTFGIDVEGLGKSVNQTFLIEKLAKLYKPSFLLATLEFCYSRLKFKDFLPDKLYPIMSCFSLLRMIQSNEYWAIHGFSNMKVIVLIFKIMRILLNSEIGYLEKIPRHIFIDACPAVGALIQSSLDLNYGSSDSITVISVVGRLVSCKNCRTSLADGDVLAPLISINVVEKILSSEDEESIKHSKLILCCLDQAMNLDSSVRFKFKKEGLTFYTSIIKGFTNQYLTQGCLSKGPSFSPFFDYLLTISSKYLNEYFGHDQTALLALCQSKSETFLPFSLIHLLEASIIAIQLSLDLEGSFVYWPWLIFLIHCLGATTAWHYW